MYPPLLLISRLTQRIVTFGAPPSATVFGSGLKAVVVMVEAPMTIEMSFAVGVGGGAFWLEGEVVLLHPATMPSRRGGRSNRRARMERLTANEETESRRAAGETTRAALLMGRLLSGYTHTRKQRTGRPFASTGHRP